MINRVDITNEAEFVAACGYERIFGSKCLAALRTYGATATNASFWVGCTPQGEPSAALYCKEDVLVVSSDNRLAYSELAEFVRQNRVSEVDTNFAQCTQLHEVLGGTVETSFYMKYEGDCIKGDFSGIAKGENLREIFDVLCRSHPYYSTHLQFEPWAEDIMLKLSKKQMELYVLHINGEAIGTGSIISEDEKVGVIAAVAIVPEQRHNRLGTKMSQFLLNRILEKGKQPMLISGYDAVAELYRKVGFVETGKWGELYL